MNKLLKYTLVGIASIITILPCFSNAGLVLKSSVQSDGNALGYYQMQNKEAINFGGAYYKCSYSESNVCRYYLGNSNTGNPMQQNVLYCFDTSYSIACDYTSVIRFLNFPQDGILNQYTESQCKSVYGLIDDSECVGMDSMTCQTTYNLIPISEVTPNYCELNFNMIDPSDCPVNEGTGAIVRSNLMINDVPYAQNQNISVFIPDFLQWNIAFNDLYTTIDVEGYNADTDYIEDVISKEQLTPTNEDFSNMLVGLANFFPYLAIAFIMFYIAKVIYKIFK